MLKILHLAPQNYAGVPYSFFQMHNASGDYSRLITYHKNAIYFPEDICLNFPLPVFKVAKKWRSRKTTAVNQNTLTGAPVFKPSNAAEAIYFSLTDLLRRNKVEKVIKEYELDSYSIIHYDGGLDFYRKPVKALKWKSEGKKIVCCYYGSDLRSRGLIKELDGISDLNITSEYDHLALKEDIHYLFYPYDPSEVPKRKKRNDGKVRIIHSPTNRIFKGTEVILKVIARLKKEKDFEFLLIEDTPRSEVLAAKSQTDICIDQVGGRMGGTGYGKAGLESLAMGIPTITNMTAEYAAWLPENPFFTANNSDELYDILLMLINDEDIRTAAAEKGIEWVNKYHGFESVNRKLKELYKLKNII